MSTSQDDPDLRTRLFVGPNASYYLEAWEVARLKKSHSWNWASFIFGEIWLSYRKMYFHVITIQMLVIAVAVFVQFVLAKSVGEALVDVVGYVFIRLFIAIYLGAYGNAIYGEFVRQNITFNIDLVGAEYANRVIRNRGGISNAAAFLTLIVLAFELALSAKHL